MGENGLFQRQLEELESLGSSDADAIIAALDKNRRAILADYALYYDSRQDFYLKEKYYRELSVSGPPVHLFSQLHELLTATHKYKIPYYVGKDQYLYSWVDLHPDGQLRCIYSGVQKHPEQAIAEDFDTIRKRFARFKQAVVNDRFARNEHIRQIIAIAREHKYNTEHVVPQSWFDEREPMKGDLHHLFVCEPHCNSARANFHYCEFDRGGERINRCGAVEPGRFEPRLGKGMAARATLYFLLRYPGKIKKRFLKDIDIALLLRWHLQDPVTEHERHRNKAIFEIQGNRNPLIDFPELAVKIDFSGKE